MWRPSSVKDGIPRARDSLRRRLGERFGARSADRRPKVFGFPLPFRLVGPDPEIGTLGTMISSDMGCEHPEFVSPCATVQLKRGRSQHHIGQLDVDSAGLVFVDPLLESAALRK